MKFGVREICDVVLKAKAAQKIGNRIFYKNEPVIYFDTLKTSSMEGAATTVYAQGGRGNARLAAWEGERTITFTMEDALISPAGFMILSGAGLVEASSEKKIKVHTTEQTDEVVYTAEDSYTQAASFVDGTTYYTKSGDVYSVAADVTSDTFNSSIHYVKSTSAASVTITLNNEPYWDANDKCIYIMRLDNGEVVTEPYIPASVSGKVLTLSSTDSDLDKFAGSVVLVDYYVAKSADTQEITITPDKFGGNFYLEASTLFRNTNGVDMPAEFIIPNCKIQSNFTFTMASSGDPSTFTFTMDAFPDYTRFDKTKKVLAAIQIIGSEESQDVSRDKTVSARHEDDNGLIVD